MSSSRIGTAKNLSANGTYDLLMVKFEGTYPEGKLSFGLYDVPMKITGIQKVAQQFLKALLSSKGSDPFYPDRGTFMPSLMAGPNITLDNSGFLSDLGEAIQDAAKQVRNISDTAAIDAESALDFAELIGADAVAEGWFVVISISTMAGENAQISVPFPEFGLGQI